MLVVGRHMASHARRQLNLLRSNRDQPIREAVSAVLDIVETLERQVEMLHRRMVLDFRKLALEPTEMLIGGDGARFVLEEEFELGERIKAHLLVPLRGGRNLVEVKGTVVEIFDGMVEVQFDEGSDEMLDLLVGFCFEHQRRERRRELDAKSA